MSKDSKAKKTKKHYKSLEKKTALWGLIFLANRFDFLLFKTIVFNFLLCV